MRSKSTIVRRVTATKHYGAYPELDGHIDHYSKENHSSKRNYVIVADVWCKNLTEARRIVAKHIGVTPNVAEFIEVHAKYTK